MKLPPFLLDHWMAAHEFSSPPIRYNLAASAGPSWTFGQLVALGGEAGQLELDEVRLSYAPPEGGRLLRERIAQLYDVDPDWVTVTAGASEALTILMSVFAEQSATIALPSPVFPAIAVAAQTWGFEVSSYGLRRQSGFAQTADSVLAAVNDKTRLVLVNTPHNPTGSVMAEHDMARLSAVLDDRGIPLVVDEVYHPMYFGSQVPSAAKFRNAIIVSDFSKAMSLSGLRLGWLIDRDPSRRQRLIDRRSYFTISSSPLTEALGVLALAHRDRILSRLQTVARTNLIELERLMHEYRQVLGWVSPSGGTVAFPWFLDGRNARSLCEAAAKEGVLIAPGDCFDALEHFRIGVGAQATGFRDALALLKGVLSTAALA